MKLSYTDGYYDVEKTYLQMQFKTYIIKSLLISDDDDDINANTLMDFDFQPNGLHSSHAGRLVSRSDEVPYTIMGLGVCNDGTFHVKEGNTWKPYKYTVSDTCTSNPGEEILTNRVEYYPSNVGGTISETRTTMSMSSTSETKSESISNGYTSKLSATLSAKFKTDVKVYKAEVGLSTSYGSESSSSQNSGHEINDQSQNSNTLISSKTIKLEPNVEYAAIDVIIKVCVSITCKLDQETSIITYQDSPCFTQTTTHFRSFNSLSEHQKDLWKKSLMKFNDATSFIQTGKPKPLIVRGQIVKNKKLKKHNKFNRRKSSFSKIQYLNMKKQKCLSKYK